MTDEHLLDKNALTQEAMVVEHISRQVEKVVGKPVAEAIMELRRQAQGELGISIGDINYEKPRQRNAEILNGDNQTVRLRFTDEGPGNRTNKFFVTELGLTHVKGQEDLNVKLNVYALPENNSARPDWRDLREYRGAEALQQWRRATDYLLGRVKRGAEQGSTATLQDVFQALQV